MYDLQPSFMPPTRAQRDFLSPDDATAMIAQRRRTGLSIVQDFCTTPQIDPVSPAQPGEWNTPRQGSTILNARNRPPHTPSYIEHQYSFPEVVKERQSSARRKNFQRCPIDFKGLPVEVFDCVLAQLEILHTGRQTSSCTTCYYRDLTAIELTCKVWSNGAKRKLYTTISIIGNDSPSQLKKYKVSHGTRLRLLRRTLREQAAVAALVKELHVPDPDIPLFLTDGQANPAFVIYRGLVASVVMACPSLETLTGFHTWYNHEYDRLTHALSTRSHLRSHCWIITENDAVTARSHTQLPPGLLDDQQVHDFIHYNSWANLETLLLCSPGSTGVIEHHVFVKVFRALPSLNNLCISSFDADDFTDATLLALPPLQSLRLEELPGVTESGLARYAARPSAGSLKRLSLIHQDIYDLLTISRLFSTLQNLKKFTIIQSDVTPALPAEIVVLQPVLASPSLESLHWDIVPNDRFSGQSGSHQGPNTHLALSILSSGFPKLRRLRAPRDVSPPGALQAVCRPAVHATVLTPSDRFSLSSMGLAHGPDTDLTRSNSLRSARLRAQSYIDSRSKGCGEFMRVVITDHSQSESFEDESDSASSASYSAASTEATDPNDLFSPNDTKIAEPKFESSFSSGPENHSLIKLSGQSSAQSCQVPVGSPRLQESSIRVTIPPRAPLRPAPVMPLKVSEFSVPAFVGRIVASTQSATAPRFCLRPDVDGCDGNGGVIGWGDLLRINEKARPESKADGARIKDGCTGAWNKGHGKGPDWWRHSERPRRRLGQIVEIDHFF